MFESRSGGCGRWLAFAERIAVDIVALAFLTRTAILAFGSGFHLEEVLGVALALAIIEAQSARS